MWIGLLVCLALLCALGAQGNAAASGVSLLDPGAWRMAPEMTDNASGGARLSASPQGLVFRVPESGRGMKWFCAPCWPNLARFPWLVVRYRAHGVVAGGESFLWADGRRLVPYERVRADGGWHDEVVDLRALGLKAPLNALMLQVLAATGGCAVEVSQIGFFEEPPPGAESSAEPVAPPREVAVPLATLQRMEPREGVASTGEGVVRLSTAGAPARWRVALDPGLEVGGFPWLLVEYRAVGARITATDPFVTVGKGEHCALRLAALVPDGRWRVVAARLPEAALKDAGILTFHLVPQRRMARVEIRAVRFASTPHTHQSLEDLPPRLPRALRPEHALPVDLSRLCNARLDRLTGASWPVSGYRFGRRSLLAAGVPFLVATGPANAVAPGSAVGRCTVSLRDVDAEGASEVYLLLAADFPQPDELAYGFDQSLRIRHPHRFRVEVSYADGHSDQAFPLRVLTRLPEVARGLDVYVVPLAGRPSELRFYDGLRLGEFGLCGLTLNKGPARFARSHWTAHTASLAEAAPARGAQALMRPSGSPAARLTRDRLVLESPGLRAEVRLRPSAALAGLRMAGIPRNVLREVVPLFTVAPWGAEERAASSEQYRLTGCRMEARRAHLAFAPPSDEFSSVALSLEAGERASIRVHATLGNGPGAARRWVFSLPARTPLRLGPRDLYSYPGPYLIVSSAEHAWDWRYYGWGVLNQYLDVSDADTGIGLAVLTKDRQALDRNVDLARRGSVTTIGVRWRLDPVLAGGSVAIPPVELAAHGEGWRGALRLYREWVATWYRPLVPRKEWFRRCFALRQTYHWEGLYDRKSDQWRFPEQFQRLQEPFGLCDYVHLYGWGATEGRGIYGDYEPWGNALGSVDVFRRAVTEFQEKYAPVGLYLVPFSDDARSDVARAHKEEWGVRQRDGTLATTTIDGPLAYLMCTGVKARRDFVTALVQRVQRQTHALGYYLDVFGAGATDCYASNHDHPPDWRTLPSEMEQVRRVRETLPAHCVLYTEHASVDLQAGAQDGSFNYSVCNYQGGLHGFSDLRDWLPVPLRLGRFVFPDFKVFQFAICAFPNTNEESYQQIFFNGDGFFLWGNRDHWFPETLAPIRKCLQVMKAHADAFAGDECEPLTPTLVPGVLANRFSGRRETVWTLFNANWLSVRGELLAVPHRDGARYFDAWNGAPIVPRIVDGRAYLSTSLEPHGVGCVGRTAGAEASR